MQLSDLKHCMGKLFLVTTGGVPKTLNSVQPLLMESLLLSAKCCPHEQDLALALSPPWCFPDSGPASGLQAGVIVCLIHGHLWGNRGTLKFLGSVKF